MVTEIICVCYDHVGNSWNRKVLPIVTFIVFALSLVHKYFLRRLPPDDDDEPPLISSGDFFVEGIIALMSKSFSGRLTTVNWFGEHNRAGAKTYIILPTRNNDRNR